MTYRVVLIEEAGIVSAESRLEEETNRLMGEGWKPLGGVSVSAEFNEGMTYYTLAQSMIKE